MLELRVPQLVRAIYFRNCL